MPREVGYSGRISILIGGKEIGRVPRLAIVDALREKGIYLLHCDKNWNVLSPDGVYPSLTEAKRRAELMYPSVGKTWIKATISKRLARAIERRNWRGHECSFCGRIPPEFQTSLHGNNAVICNICVEETYHEFLESEQLESARPPRGDYFPKDGFNNIESYISRLVGSTNTRKHMSIFALGRMRGFGLLSVGNMLQASFVVSNNEENSRETGIRAFFASEEKSPSSDYLADNGRVRILQFPINGNIKELTLLTKTILQQLFNISPKEALTIQYIEK